MPGVDNTWSGRIIFGLSSVSIIGLLAWGGTNLVGIKESLATINANQANANERMDKLDTQLDLMSIALSSKIQDQMRAMELRLNTLEVRDSKHK